MDKLQHIHIHIHVDKLPHMHDVDKLKNKHVDKLDNMHDVDELQKNT